MAKEVLAWQTIKPEDMMQEVDGYRGSTHSFVLCGNNSTDSYLTC